MSPTPLMSRWLRVGPALLASGTLCAGIIQNVSQTNGDSDRPTARFTGQTFDVMNGATLLRTGYTVPRFGEDALCMTDRIHEWNGVSTNVPIPAYLLGAEYVVIANNNRDNVGLEIKVDLNAPAWVYLLIDNRVGDGDASNPPNLAAAMTWVTANGWTPVQRGLNRTADATRPDEIGYDENGDVSINQVASVYARLVTTPSVTLFDMLEGRNMYGVVVAPALIEGVNATGDDPESERPKPKFTGQTYTLVNGTTVIRTNYTMPLFGEDAFAMTDRNHQWNGASPQLPIPAYLAFNEYVAIANNNRDNPDLVVDVSLRARSLVYLLVDNRIGNGSAATPPDFSANMFWVAGDGWNPVSTGRNRAGDPSAPDEVGYDENADVSINQWASVYARVIEPGSAQFYSMNEGRNIYGIVVTPALPPTAPTGLSVLQVSDGRVRLGWNVTQGAWTYTVRRSPSSEGPFVIIADNLGSETFEDTGLENGIRYHYRISAFNLIGESNPSAEVTAKPEAAPMNFTATGGPGVVNLSWNALIGANTYQIRRSTTPGGPYEVVADHVVGTTHADTTVDGGRFYHYVVFGILGEDQLSGASAEASALTAPGAPTPLNADPLSTVGLSVRWVANNPVVSEYIIDRSFDGVNFSEAGTVPGNRTRFTTGGLTPDTTYFFQVRARNASGTSPASPVFSGRTPASGLFVNFANPTFTDGAAGYPIPGYLDDYGDIFHDRGNGIAYGWSEDNLGNARHRVAANSPDERYDTFNHLQRLGTDMIWEIAVPNGRYSVYLVAGDATAVDSVFQFDVEGVVTARQTPGAGQNWREFTVECTVADGLLTLRSGPQAANNKLAFVMIQTVPDEPPTITSITRSGDSVTIQWTGGGSLQAANVLGAAPGWTLVGSGGSVTEPASGEARFYRVIR